MIYNGMTFFLKNPSWLIRKEWSRLKTRRYVYQPIANINYNISNRYSVFESINIDETTSSLKSQGFTLDLNLPQTVTQEIKDFAMRVPCSSNQTTHHHYYTTNKKETNTHLQKALNNRGIYDDAALHCPAIKTLENDSNLLQIAANYLKTESVYTESQLWWSFAVESTVYERRRAVQMFRQELKDARCLKFVFYLTDVDLCSNPHVCVRGSHVKKKLSHRFASKACSTQEITDYYGYNNIVPICGKAGFGFVEDGRCFHKLISPSSNDRLTLEIKFVAKS
ncbi:MULTISPECIES: phytanoyl-CoA dioxygenase family protein [unclassified Coleofasciculus]|uniref:phytanoyl-CoA dioxygenase family protein n=1 Tax=unclassified Coleofasciculus TaxID=2692782 RepID=UPI00187E9216|nr:MULTISPECIES: phytanoyl-CoA dioxygenase family protein [unclassified Coleofasciculus]MBE9125989.1 phytanoyl-CoA dioxygenase family protein [Coleofasciculus sp. LEGE 07081]MBE9151183.1 phytanoyl-CoA dioxygenase family protein [Coleofasciculus sp. LEGE 07092]